MLGSGETSTFSADSLHPDTVALVDKGYLRTTVPNSQVAAIPKPLLSPLVWGGNWQAGVYQRGVMVSHSGVLWVSNVDSNSSVPSVDNTDWSASAGSGDAASHAALLNNPHGVTANQTGSIPTQFRGAAGGVAPLDQNGLIPLSAIPDLLQIATLLEAYQLRHQHDTDKGLDLGGPNEVLASEIKDHLENVSTNPHNVTLLQLGGVASSLMGQAGGVATLNGSGKLSASQLPTLRLTNVFLVDNNTQRDALAASLQVGDAVVVQDTVTTYLWNGSDYSQVTSGVNVVSVNGQTGVLIELTTDDILEGSSRLYFTNERVASSPIVAQLLASSHQRNKDGFLDYGGSNQVSAASLNAHLHSVNNPHAVTAQQAGALPKLSLIHI